MNTRIRTAACLALAAIVVAVAIRTLKRSHDPFAESPDTVDPTNFREQRGEATLGTPEDPYENRPTAVVYDVFAEASGRLISQYAHLSNRAETPEDRERWWRKVMEVRNSKRAVPAHDRDQLIRHIIKWTAESEALESTE